MSTQTVDEFVVTYGDGTLDYADPTTGERHRDDDQPALIRPNGDEEWWIHGRRHRDGDKPAVIVKGKREEYWTDGVLHRAGDRPAIIHSSGMHEFYENGRLHRLTGPAQTIQPNALTRGLFGRDEVPIEWHLHGQKASEQQEAALAVVYSADTPMSARLLLAFVGNDPWIAAVALANPLLTITGSTHAFLTLLASNARTIN